MQFVVVLNLAMMEPILPIVTLQGFFLKKFLINFFSNLRTVLVESSTGRECFSTELVKTHCILFSPKDKYMVTYEP